MCDDEGDDCPFGKIIFLLIAGAIAVWTTLYFVR